MPYLLMLVCGLLLYGSLYPWQFHDGPALSVAARHVFAAWPSRLGLSELKDIIVNLVIYAPVGFLGYLSQRNGFRLWRAAWPVGLAFGLSFSVETLQHYCAHRVPSLMDVLCNTVGGLAGVIAASVFEATLRSRWRTIRAGRMLRPSSALMLMLLWSVYHLLPLRPIPSGFIMKLRTLAYGAEWNWMEYAGAMLIWLTFDQLFRSIATPSAARQLLLWSGPVVLLGRLAAPGRTFTWHEAAGIFTGTLIALLIGARLQLKPFILAITWIVWLVADELRPFQFTAQAHPVNWVPFLDLLHSEWIKSVLTLLRKCCIYGTAFWCIEHTSLRPSRVLSLLMLLIATLEAFQVWLPERVPSTTDVALVLVMGALLWRLERKYGATLGSEGVFHNPSSLSY